MRLLITLLLSLTLSACSFFKKEDTIRLTFLDDFYMTAEPLWGLMTPGQLSGLVFDKNSGTFLAISDDRYDPDRASELRADPRYYKLKIDITQNPTTRQFHIFLPPQTDFTYFATKAGSHFAYEELDAEGLALLPNNHIAVSSEGNASQTERAHGTVLPPVGPGLFEFDRAGSFLQNYPIPDYYQPVFEDTRTVRGIPYNRGFESLSYFNSHLYTCTEAPLVQDGGPVSFEKGAYARLLQFTQKDQTFVPSAEFAYPVDPIPLPASWGQKGPATHGDSGVVEMIALDESTFLVLERAYVDAPYFRNHIRLYKASLRGATNTLGQETLKADIKPVQKELVLDFDTLLENLEPNDLKKLPHGTLENYEGMALVTLPDGHEGLIVISDNNFNVKYQRQALLLFRLDRL